MTLACFYFEKNMKKTIKNVILPVDITILKWYYNGDRKGNRKLRRANTMSNYAKAFEVMIKKGESLEDLNRANHMALESGKITMAEFQEAARVLVKEFLKN